MCGCYARADVSDFDRNGIEVVRTFTGDPDGGLSVFGCRVIEGGRCDENLSLLDVVVNFFDGVGCADAEVCSDSSSEE